MALTPAQSPQYAAMQTQDKLQSLYKSGKVRAAYATWKATAAGQGEAPMIALPPGRVLIHYDISRILTNSTFVSGAQLSVGHAAYVNQDGTIVPADHDEWFANLDPQGTAGDRDKNFRAGAKSVLVEEYNSQQGIDVTITVDTQNASIDAEVALLVYYSVEA